MAKRIVAKAMPAWSPVKFEGWQSREGVAGKVLAECAPDWSCSSRSHEMVTLPIKLFEYMAAGVPVISSDFPLWREIVDDAQCGLLVDPAT